VPLIVKPPHPGRRTGEEEGRSGGQTDATNAGHDDSRVRTADHSTAGGGALRPEIVELVDLAPTITDYCGIPTPAFFQGRSLRAIPSPRDAITGRTASRAQAPHRTSGSSALIETGFPGGPGFKAIRTDRYLYARHRDGTERLYDLDADPDQVAPLDPPPPALLAEARGEMLSRLLAAEPAYPRRTADY
jgi:arylsulfatase A-like enzyme